MTLNNIQPGQTLKLKPERQATYGLASPYITVAGFKEKTGYKSFWVFAIEHDGTRSYYKPSDFEKRLYE